MSAQDSNLTVAGYDMVCAISQDALNVTLMEYLQPDREAFTACYVKDHQGNLVLTPVEQISAWIGIGGADPFTAGEQIAGGLSDVGFFFGFKAKLGLLKLPRGSRQPPMVRLDQQDGASVTHQIYFAEFTLLWVFQNDGDEHASMVKIVQDSAAPVIFPATVNLNVRDAAFSTLPQATQDAITSLNPNTMFGVKQIVLDFAGAPPPRMAVANYRGYEDGDSPAFDELAAALPAAIADQYHKHLPAEAAIVGYGVHATTPQASSSIVPADLAFRVSPGLTPDNAPTLDYLVMTAGSMPASAPFTWDWIAKSDEADFNGVMAIRRDIFRDYLRQAATAASSSLAMTLEFGNDETPSIVASSEPLQWVDWSFFPGIYASQSASASGWDVSMTYEMSAMLVFQNAKLHLQLNCVAAWHFTLRSPAHDSVSKNIAGNFVNYTVDVDYVLGVTDAGKLTVAMSQPVITDKSDDIAEQFDSVSATYYPSAPRHAQSITSAKTAFDGTLQNAMQQFEATLAGGVGGIGSWVFPGGKTFAFKDAVFSDGSDLLVHLTYVNPN